MKPMNVRVSAATIVLLTLACLCSSTPTQPVKIGDATAGSSPISSNQTYSMGDIIQAGTSTITLNSASIQGNTLHANFTIENKGSSEITISSLLLFSARNSDGTALEIDIFNCESGSLDVTVLAGDKLKGNICWTGVVSNSVKIYYDSSLFTSGGTVVWEITK